MSSLQRHAHHSTKHPPRPTSFPALVEQGQGEAEEGEEEVGEEEVGVSKHVPFSPVDDPQLLSTIYDNSLILLSN